MTLIIGDIHGSTPWKDIMRQNPSELTVFLGDYCDSHEASPRRCIDTAVEIFELAKAKPKNVVCLVGNHDYHYLPWVREVYSGFNRKFSPEYGNMLLKYKRLLSMVKEVSSANGKYLLSHAGVSKTFLDLHNLTVEQLNEAWEKRPGIFDFNMRYTDLSGNDPFQSPIWIRPEALLKDMIPDYHQIVGHTFSLEVQTHKATGGQTLTVVCTEAIDNFVVL
jgi:hypothetical protein